MDLGCDWEVIEEDQRKENRINSNSEALESECLESCDNINRNRNNGRAVWVRKMRYILDMPSFGCQRNIK